MNNDATQSHLPASPLRVVCNGVVFLSAFILACVGARWLLPFPEVPVVRDKLEHLEKQGNDYDVIFTGSSRMYFQVMPEVFDRAAAEHGLQVKSFNAGVSAMVPPEDGYLMDQILQRPHRRLRWALIECMPLSPSSDATLTGTKRFSYWHDWERTQLLTQRFMQDYANAKGTAGARLQAQARAVGTWAENLKLFAENSTNMGGGGALTTRWLGTAKMKKSLLLARGNVADGWLHPPGEQYMSGKRLEDYQRDLARLQQTQQRYFDSDPVSDQALRSMVEKLRRSGVTPILVIPPTVAAKRFRADQSLVTFDFSDPLQYPEFFAPEHRMDGVHLNAAGAEIFSRALAQRFEQFLKEKGDGL